MSDDEISLAGDMFEEPEGFLPPPPDYHNLTYTPKHLKTEIKLRLVGKSPLWGHLLWNAGRYTAEYIESHLEELIQGKTIIEFGSASGLPCILALQNKADFVVATDYPDADLLSNITHNLTQNNVNSEDKVKVEGFIWGNDTSDIKELIKAHNQQESFDTLIMSDLVFNHTEHFKLLKSCKELIKPLSKNPSTGELIPRSGGKCLVVFSPHRPHLIANDLKFFEDAKNDHGFDVEEIEMIHWDVPMFPDDPIETEEIRKRIYSYYLHPTW